MSSTPIYDELAAILLVDHPAADAAPQHQAEQAAEEPAKQVRTGGRRRKPEPEA